MVHNAYSRFVLDTVPRLLSQLDRDKYSSTFGCFDRNHWHYKIRDFSSIVLQQGSLSLALLYSYNFLGNIYYKNKKILEWSLGSIEYWISQQLSDGSFNEYWPNEHGYPPTVFSLFSVAESFSLLKEYVPVELNERFLHAAMKSCRFIAHQEETGAQNQEIASIAALQSVENICRERWLKDTIESKRDAILSKQSIEGWFSEYGGADIGYLSVSLHFLAEYYRISHDNSVLENLKRIIEYLQYFIHPDGTVGGEYGSRNTEYFLPGGLEIVADEIPLARSISNKLLAHIDEPGILPRSVDDRYLSHYFLHSYIRALLHHRKYDVVPLLPCEKKDIQIYFNDSKNAVISRSEYYAIFNLSKKVIKVYSGKREIYNDCGYFARIGDISAVTNWLDPTPNVMISENEYGVEGLFFIQPWQVVPSPFKHISLRCLSYFAGKKLIPLLKSQLIAKNSSVPIKFQRKVIFDDNFIFIEDMIRSEKNIEFLSTIDSFSKRYVPSSKYFQIKELYREGQETLHENIHAMRITKQIDLLNDVIQFNYDTLSSVV